MLLTGLRADFLPHRQWAQRRWYYATPLWYYHGPAASHAEPHAATAYNLIDPDLRELCRALYERGLRTTPSCQGHFYPQSYFHEVWRALQHEAKAVVGSGLPVRDSETNALYLWREPAYSLPWGSFEAFYGQAAGHQGMGYLGILLSERQQVHTFAPLMEDPPWGARVEYDGNMLHLMVDASSPSAQTHCWRALTQRVQVALAAGAQGLLPIGYERHTAL